MIKNLTKWGGGGSNASRQNGNKILKKQYKKATNNVQFCEEYSRYKTKDMFRAITQFALWFFVLAICSSILFIGNNNRPYFKNDTSLISTAATISGLNGDGTSSNPYQISSQAHLQIVADKVKNDSMTFDGSYLKVTADFSVDNTWVGIGTLSSNAFCGEFDGDGHTITFNDSQQGIFGYIKSATIQNVVAKGRISSDSVHYLGSIAGYTKGCTIENCSNLGNISLNGDYDSVGGITGLVSNSDGESSYITGCSNSGKIVGGTAGGIAGWLGCAVDSGLSSIISDCYNLGFVTDSASSSNGVGGIAGVVAGKIVKIEKCYNYGRIEGNSTRAGGIAGIEHGSTIDNCYNAGSIYGRSTDYAVGGIVGVAAVHVNEAEFYSCYNTGSVSAIEGEDVGGIVGYRGTPESSAHKPATFKNCFYLDSSTPNSIAVSGVTSKTSSQLKSSSTYSSWTSFSTNWGISSNKNKGYPYLKSIPASILTININGGTINGASSYTISLPEGVEFDLNLLEYSVSNGYKSSVTYTKTSGTGTLLNNKFTFGNADGVIKATVEKVLIEYTITYNLDGGTLENAIQKYTVETADFALGTPHKEGYTFIGWTGSNLSAATLSVVIAKGSTGDLTYIANWEKNKNSIITLSFKIIEGDYFIVYILNEDNVPTTQISVNDGVEFSFNVENGKQFTILVCAVFGQRCEYKDNNTNLVTTANKLEYLSGVSTNTSITVTISRIKEVNNYVGI